MIRVAYQGARGAFGHEACLAFLPDAEPIAYASFAAAAAAVADGHVERAILPIENTIAGPVPGMAELLARPDLERLSTHSLPVRMHLLGVPGASLDLIARAYSHPMALKQCQGTLRDLGIQPVDSANTAVAAQWLGEQRDPTSAVLASEAAARIYGLAILRRDVQDRPDNRTTFAIIGKAQAGGVSQSEAPGATATR